MDVRNGHQQRNEEVPGNPTDWSEYFKFQRNRDSPGDTRNALLVVVALFVTITFQAGLNPPSGILDVMKSNSTGGTATPPKQFMGFTVTSVLFVFPNTLGLSASVCALIYLTTGLPFQRELYIAMHSILFTYGVAIGSLGRNNVPMWILTSIAYFIPFGARYIPKWFKNCRS